MREKEREKFKEKSKIILNKIVKRRKKIGITQVDLAELLNLTYSGYFKIETGKTKLDTNRLFEILDLLKISPKEFFKDFK
jgi:transcriptional regulator with XRE-family HTH domain